LTQIFFYHNATDRIAATALLIRKAYAQKKAVLIYAPDAELASVLNRHLWMHPPTGFVPHVRSDSPLAGETPVLIADRLDELPQNERLINLSVEIPPAFARFTSVIEVVGQADEERLAGRSRAKFYKDHGYEIKYFDLSGKN
jgi:DNA polymerase III subunit chi